mmetsp:Transcript_41870/g.118381  ORF Transcript_41870/g.118381 Transcript_41870/m.118381 type:complete len:206 (+) Transcript_41870:829-1446(+)
MNSARICGTGFPMTFARTLRRPRCGMLKMNSSQPSSMPRSTRALRPGMTASPPSRPNRFVFMNLLPRKRSKVSAMHRRSYVSSIFARSSEKKSGISMCLRIQLRRSFSPMCMYSTPIVPQYVERTRAMRSARVISPAPMFPMDARKPALPPVLERQSMFPSVIRWPMSASLKPWYSGASSLTPLCLLHWCCPRGSMSAASCPRTW